MSIKNPAFLLTLLPLSTVLLGINIAHAQPYQPSNRIPVSDGTLGTQVWINNNNPNIFSIQGGLQKGHTLFHSFTDFSVPKDGQANFSINPWLNTRDIITRVTGGFFSDINGSVNTSGANFFLINPNGIVFGPNAQLNVGKIFVGSTANGIDLVGNGGQTITFGTNPNSNEPLLSINPNVFFNVSRLNMGGGNSPIVNYGTLKTSNNSYIGLIGGNVILDGGYGKGNIIASGGRVDIGGLNSAGTVTTDDKGLVFSGNHLIRSDVWLVNGGIVDVHAEQTLGNINTFSADGNSLKSSININANNINLINDRSTFNFGQSSFYAGLDNNVVTTAPAGDININATGKVTLDYGGIYYTRAPGAVGAIGNIKIDAKSLDLKNKSTISSITGGTGNAGNVTISTTGDLTLENSNIQSDNNGTGNAGEITIRTTTNGGLTLDNFSTIRSNNNGTGNAGKIDIATTNGDLTLNNHSDISSDNYFIGNAGDIKVDIKGNINISGVSNSQSQTLIDSTTSLSKISSTTWGRGNTGKITIEAKGDINLSNGAAIFSSITPRPPTQPRIFDSNGVEITAHGTTSQGIEIKNARNINLSNFSTIQSTNFGGKGKAGDINITNTGDIKITGADLQSALFQRKFNNSIPISGIFSSTLGEGDTGKITIDTKGDITLSNNAGIMSQISAPLNPAAGNRQVVIANGDSQGIEIKNARNINLQNYSTIQSTNFGGKGHAGDIDIINIGNIKITGIEDPQFSLNSDPLSLISSNTSGKGNTGKITLQNIGDITLANGAGISSSIISNSSIQIFDPQGVEIKVDGYSKGIEIKNTRNLNLSNFSSIRSDNGTSGNKKNNAGNIDLTTTGDIKIDAGSFISTSTYGKGDTGKIRIGTDGDLIFTNESGLYSSIAPTANGDSKGIEITKARNLTLTNSAIRADNNGGNGNSGQIKIDTTGKLTLNQSGIYSTLKKTALGNSQGIKIDAGELDLKDNSTIDASTFGSGHAGSIKIETQGNYKADNSHIFAITHGNGAAGDIELNAKSVTLNGGAEIQALSDAKGKVGNITVTTPDDGFITISGNAPSINGKLPDGRPGGFASGLMASAEKDSSSIAGKIYLKTGTLKIESGGAITTRTQTDNAPDQPNNPNSLIVNGKFPVEPGPGSISIDAKNINITGGGQISTTSTGNASAGDIFLTNASAKLVISGSDQNYDKRIADLKVAFPNGYRVDAIVDITTGNIVSSSIDPNYEQQKASLFAANPKGYKVENLVDWNAEKVVNFTTLPVNQFSGIFATNGEGKASTGKGGSIIMNPISVTISDLGQISVSNKGRGEGGNITLNSNIVTLNNGTISAKADNATGGNITLNTNDYLFLRNGSEISTTSGSTKKNGNGGNITIKSPRIIALPGNNDITANANGGKGGNINITSQGLFGIQYRPKRQDSPFTNDITASSEFGQQGTVTISTPGTDPAKDKGELAAAPDDASKKISQVCGESQRANKFYIIGKGGHPPNAEDPLTSEVVWHDPRVVKTQPVASNSSSQATRKLVPPAVGWVFDGKGKVTLIAAQTEGEPTGTRVVCPNVGK